MHLDTANIKSAARVDALRRGIEAAKQCASIARMASRQPDSASGLHYIVDRHGATFSEHPSQVNAEASWISADVPNDLSRMSVVTLSDASTTLALLTGQHPDRAPLTLVKAWDHALGLAQRWAEMLVAQADRARGARNGRTDTTKDGLEAVQLGTRLGPIDSAGAYFSTCGSSTYFDPTDVSGRTQLYDLSNLRIADTSSPELCVDLVTATMRQPNIDEAARARLSAALSSALEGEPHIDYLLADETPIADAARHLGYDAVLLWENDDWTDPSSLFVWNVGKVRALDDAQSQIVRARLDERESVQNTSLESVDSPSP